MATQAKKRLVFSDESLNSIGTWVKTLGIDLKQFLKNSVMYYNHNKTTLPIGTWEDIEINKDTGEISGVPVFDMDDPFAKMVADKYEKGILKAASIGVRVLELSDDKKYLKPGQTLPTIIKCKLIEVSIVDIPANDNALVLYDDNEKIIDLSLTNLNQILKIQPLKTEKSMTTLALALGLPESATEAEILAKIQSDQNAKTVLETRLDTLETEAKTKEQARIESLVNLAIQEQKITADKKELYLGIGKTSGVETLEKLISEIQPVQRASAQINLKSGDGAEKKFAELSYEEISDLKLNNKDTYIALYKEEFGEEPDLS